MSSIYAFFVYVFLVILFIIYIHIYSLFLFILFMFLLFLFNEFKCFFYFWTNQTMLKLTYCNLHHLLVLLNDVRCQISVICGVYTVAQFQTQNFVKFGDWFPLMASPHVVCSA